MGQGLKISNNFNIGPLPGNHRSFDINHPPAPGNFTI